MVNAVFTNGSSDGGQPKLSVLCKRAANLMLSISIALALDWDKALRLHGYEESLTSQGKRRYPGQRDSS